MLIYEKDNKLNISFENNMDETDIVVGKDEVKIGEATISDSNVLPVPEEGDIGKVPVVQEDGSYALANADGGGVLIVYENNGTLDKTWAEINAAARTRGVVVINVDDAENETSVTLFVPYSVTYGAEKGYKVTIENSEYVSEYVTDTPNGYPTLG